MTLKEFKRNNKQRRESIAVKNGYSSAEEYIKSLNGGITGIQHLNPVTTITTNPPVDVVIAFDCTASMSSMIGAVKNKVKDFTNVLFEKVPNLQMGIVAFGDYCDSPSTRFQFSNLLPDANSVTDFINKTTNTGGGDTPEFYEYVIKHTNEDTNWRSGKRIVILFGDAMPHESNYPANTEHIDWKNEAHKSANNEVIFHAIYVHTGANGNRDGFYDSLASITNGMKLDFTNANEVVKLLTGVVLAEGSKEEFKKEYNSIMSDSTSSKELKRSMEVTMCYIESK